MRLWNWQPARSHDLPNGGIIVRVQLRILTSSPAARPPWDQICCLTISPVKFGEQSEVGIRFMNTWCQHEEEGERQEQRQGNPHFDVLNCWSMPETVLWLLGWIVSCGEERKYQAVYSVNNAPNFTWQQINFQLTAWICGLTQAIGLYL
jgi:hypothetical protein